MENLNLVKPEKVQNIINKFCYTIGMIPTSYKVSLTYEEQIIAIGHYLEETVIPALNNNAEAVAELQTLFVQLKDYVENYFDDLNVQEEINNKLNQMAQDGTLSKIINENIFNELNNKVNTLQEEYEKTKLKNNIYLGAFFNDSEKINFCISNDGVNFSDILPNVNIRGRDPNILYNPANKTFYLCVTGSGTTWDFTCYTSQDLINWNRHYVSLGILTGSRWAPELFFDKNGDLWATITAGADNNTLSLFKAKCNNVELLTFDTRTPINLTQQNIIDSNIIYDKDNDIYYLTCKNNTTYLQLIYSSLDLENWDLVNSNVLKTGEPCEGGFMIKTNKKFTFYGDTWQSFNYFIMAQSENPADFNNFTRPNSLINKRHGSICFIENQEAVALITNLESYKQMENINNISSRQYDLSGNIENLIVYPKFVYRVTDDCVINNLINAFDLENFEFYFATRPNAKLTIKKVFNSEYVTKNINKTISNTINDNEKLNFISLIGDPKILKDDNFIVYDIQNSVRISNGWEANVYLIKRYGDFIHIDLDAKKISSDAGDTILTIINDSIKPTFNTFSISNQAKSIWLKANGELNINFSQENQNNFISFEYLSI